MQILKTHGVENLQACQLLGNFIRQGDFFAINYVMLYRKRRCISYAAPDKKRKMIRVMINGWEWAASSRTGRGPEECMLREVFEETGLTLTEYAFRESLLSYPMSGKRNICTCLRPRIMKVKSEKEGRN